MKLILCVDDCRGMAFNRRRQSRDRLLVEDLVRTVGQGTLWISPYSVPLFAEHSIKILTAEDPLLAAKPQDTCFLELQKPQTLEAIDTLILYRWNRHYPADLYFDTDLSDFRITEICELVGSSHPKITKEVWKK